MAENVFMIALSPTMEEGTIISWKKNEGDSVDSGDVLCEVETDKASMEYESTQEGTLLKIIVPEGGSARVGDTIAVLGEEGEDISEIVKKAMQSEHGEATETVGRTQETGAEQQTKGHIKSSPLARKLARQRGIDIREVTGSGPGGRIVRHDIEKFEGQSQVGKVKAATSPEKQQGAEGVYEEGKGGAYPESAPMYASAKLEEKEIVVSRKRSVIARRLSESKYSAPHYYLRASLRMDALLDARAKLNTSLKDEKISLNAFFLKMIAESLKHHPMVNASWQGDTIKVFGSVDIGVAVALKDGLITPVVRNCESKGIRQIDHELRPLIAKAREGKLQPDEYEGATFSISNLGNYGIEEFTAIINPPGSAILALGEIKKSPSVDNNDQLYFPRTMRMTLSCDHRVIDGAVGAGFLRTLVQTIEEPIRAIF